MAEPEGEGLRKSWGKEKAVTISVFSILFRFCCPCRALFSIQGLHVVLF